MKKLLFALCLSCVCAAGIAQDTNSSAQQALPAPPRANTAVIPDLSPGFQAKHSNNLEVAKRGDIDVLFMGDSITDFWRNAPRNVNSNGVANQCGKAVFDKYFSSMKVANFGIAGDTTQGVLWRLQHGEGQGIKPKAVMLMIGTNNTGGRGGGNTASEIALGVADVVFELRKDFPDAKILLLAIFPRGNPSDSARKKITEINGIISGLNDNQHVFYRDIGSIFLSSDGTISTEIMNDRLHPTSKGYELWAQAVKDTLASWLN